MKGENRDFILSAGAGKKWTCSRSVCLTQRRKDRKGFGLPRWAQA